MPVKVQGPLRFTVFHLSGLNKSLDLSTGFQGVRGHSVHGFDCTQGHVKKETELRVCIVNLGFNDLYIQRPPQLKRVNWKCLFEQPQSQRTVHTIKCRYPQRVCKYIRFTGRDKCIGQPLPLIVEFFWVLSQPSEPYYCCSPLCLAPPVHVYVIPCSTSSSSAHLA